MANVEEQIKIIKKGADEVIGLEDLRDKLESAHKNNTQLVIKLGLDPSAPDIHLGHAVVLRKIKQIQDLGHKAVIIIGDFTGMIGDPTGKSKTRKALTKEEVIDNAKTYQEQIFKILDKDKTEVRFNSEWLAKLNFRDVIELASKCTVARMMEREDFKKRYKNNESIGIHEFFYPLMQGYDSVELQADIELGATEQRFNILMGRALQKDFNQPCQVALFMPILIGLDGVEKMSKSLGNYVGINEHPNDIYGKIMSLPDELIIPYFELTTDVHPDKIEQYSIMLDNDEVNPRDIKMKLAFEITMLYNGKNLAKDAEQNFKQVFQNKNMPKDIQEFLLDSEPDISGKFNLIQVIMDAGLVGTKSEIRRLLSSGAVRINGLKTTEFTASINNGDIIQVGKRRFVKIVIK